jgi:translation initiation factor IF-2
MTVRLWRHRSWARRRARASSAMTGPCHGHDMAAAIGECNALELVPAGLVRVQIGRLAGQALHVQPLGGPASQEVLAGGPPVTRRPVPDHEPLTADRAQPHAQEADPIGRAVGVRWRVRLPQPAPVGRDAAAGAERVMGERPTQEGGRSPWRPGAYGPGRTARGSKEQPDGSAQTTVRPASAAFVPGPASAPATRPGAPARRAAPPARRVAGPGAGACGAGAGGGRGPGATSRQTCAGSPRRRAGRSNAARGSPRPRVRPRSVLAVAPLGRR